VFVLAVFRSILRVLEMGTGAESLPAAHGAVPVWLDRLARGAGAAAVVGLVVAAVQVVVRIPSLVVPAVLATVIAATLLPIVQRLRGAGGGRLAPRRRHDRRNSGHRAHGGLTIAWTLAPLRDILATAAEARGVDPPGWRTPGDYSRSPSTWPRSWATWSALRWPCSSCCC
jgi:hypothetical protein